MPLNLGLLDREIERDNKPFLLPLYFLSNRGSLKGNRFFLSDKNNKKGLL